jgi:hypothetical protein
MNLFGFFKPKAKAGPRVNNPKIGFLISATHGSGDVAGVWDQYITAFQSAICTSNVQYFEEPPGGGVGPHGAGGDKGKYDTAANNLVSVHKVNVIVTGGTLAATECQKYTTTIPIVVASAGDPNGLAGSQLTGCTNGQANTQISDARITTMNNNLKPTAVGVHLLGVRTVPTGHNPKAASKTAHWFSQQRVTQRVRANGRGVSRCVESNGLCGWSRKVPFQWRNRIVTKWPLPARGARARVPGDRVRPGEIALTLSSSRAAMLRA